MLVLKYYIFGLILRWWECINRFGSPNACLRGKKHKRVFTYTKPKDKIAMSTNFCFFWICRFDTIQIGSSNTRASVNIDTLAVPVTKSAKFMHLAPTIVTSQFAWIGTQWRAVRRKVVIIMKLLNINRAHIALRTLVFCPARRRRKSRMGRFDERQHCIVE